MKKRLYYLAGLCLLIITCFLLINHDKTYHIKHGKHPETLVYVRTGDEVIHGGIFFIPPTEKNKLTAILWIHGWGTNFYNPAYVKIGRAVSEHGYPFLSANTRMHDLANSMRFNADGKRIRGGGYWGKASEQSIDISAWMDFLETEGYKRVVIVGHSAGWSAVRYYQYKHLDKRVVGLVAASGNVYPNSSDLSAADAAMLADAHALIKEGRGDQLIEIKGRSFPSYISADTFADNHQSEPEEESDFFGFTIDKPALLKVDLPCLAFFGSRGDVAGNDALQLIKKTAEKFNTRIDTKMIQGGDHMYKGKESDVAKLISAWIEQL